MQGRRGYNPLNPMRLAAALFFAAVVRLPAQLTLPSTGCPMAHCTNHLNDAVGLISPSTNVVSTPAFAAGPGAKRGLGCSSNGSIAACTFGSTTGPNLIGYTAGGTELFTDNGLFDQNAYTSAPIVFSNGAVLAADDQTMALFSPNPQPQPGYSITWSTKIAKVSHGGDSPLSPVPVPSGPSPAFVVIARRLSGWISTYNVNTGAEPAHSIQVKVPINNIDTVCTSANTPAVDGSNVYIAEQCGTNTGVLAIVAVAADGSMTYITSLSWNPSFQFLAPSGASPTFANGMVYFDGSTPAGGGVFYGVPANGIGTIVSTAGFRTFKAFKANAPFDPVRNGIWVWDVGDSNLYLLDAITLEPTSVPVIPAGYLPSSAISLSRRDTNNDVILTFGAIPPGKSSVPYITAMDVTTSIAADESLFATPLNQTVGNYAAGQFPIVYNNAEAFVVCVGSESGTFFVGPSH